MANEERRLIDPSNIICSLKAMASEYDAITLPGMIKALQEESTVDAVEVVRCKDCKHYAAMSELDKEFGFKDFSCSIFCGGYERPYPTEPDDYCSYGERKDSHGAGD